MDFWPGIGTNPVIV